MILGLTTWEICFGIVLPAFVLASFTATIIWYDRKTRPMNEFLGKIAFVNRQLADIAKSIDESAQIFLRVEELGKVQLVVRLPDQARGKGENFFLHEEDMHYIVNQNQPPHSFCANRFDIFTVTQMLEEVKGRIRSLLDENINNALDDAISAERHRMHLVRKISHDLNKRTEIVATLEISPLIWKSIDKGEIEWKS